MGLTYKTKTPSKFTESRVFSRVQSLQSRFGGGFLFVRYMGVMYKRNPPNKFTESRILSRVRSLCSAFWVYFTFFLRVWSRFVGSSFCTLCGVAYKKKTLPVSSLIGSASPKNHVLPGFATLQKLAFLQWEGENLFMSTDLCTCASTTLHGLMLEHLSPFRMLRPLAVILTWC